MFEMTADHQAIVEVSRQFADEFLAPNAIEWDRNKHFPADIIRKGAELGLGGMYVREDVGGSGLTRLDAALIIEALATGCPSIASYVSIHNMTAWMIDEYGKRMRATPVPAGHVHHGEVRLVLPDRAGCRFRCRGDCHPGGPRRRRVRPDRCQAVHLRCRHQRRLRRDGPHRRPGPKGISAFVVELGSRRTVLRSVGEQNGMECAADPPGVLDEVRVPAENLLGDEGEGFRIAMSGLNGGRVNIGASSLGGAQAALDKTLSYMHDRQAFGQPIDRLQSLQFYVADMATRLEAARLLLWKAASAMDTKSPDVVKLCAMAKKFATDTGFDVANQALQIHGGYGYLTEYGIEKIVRDLRVHQILEGTNEIMQVVIARSLIGS